VSSRKVILICGLGYAAGQAMFGLAQTELAMVGARMFAGIFISGAFTGLLTYIVNLTPPDLRGRHLTIFATIQMVAGAFGFFVGGMLGELGVGFAMVGQVIILAGGGVALFLVCADDRTQGSQAVSLGRLLREANPVASFAAGRSLLTPLLTTIFVITALASLGGTAFDQSFNYYLKAQLGLSSGYNGAIKGVIGLVSLLTNGTLGMWLMTKTNISKTSIYVYLLCAVAMLGVVVWDAAVPFVTANILYFALLAISVPLTQSLVAKGAEGKDSNLTMGYFGGMKSLGAIAGSLAAGFLYTVNSKLPFVLGLASFLLATVAAVRYRQLESRGAAG
jgi:DHA1 family multidrug resistance protein-like MFS transporter